MARLHLWISSNALLALLLGAHAAAAEPSSGGAPAVAPHLAPRLAPQAPERHLTTTVLSPAVSKPDPKPASRLPAFIFLGIGSLSAGGALVAGIMEGGQKYDPKYDCPRCRDRAMDETLATTTKILAGVAAVGVSTGIVLLLSAPRKEKPGFTPSLGVNFSGTKATAKVSWKF